MQDPQYRLAIAWQNVAYNQPPHPSFFIGHGMGPLPAQDIKIVNADVNVEVGETITIQENENGYCGFVGGGTVDSNHVGFTGTGFSNSENNVGEGLIYAVSALPGEYTFVFRYALESGNRSADIIINDAVNAGTIDFPATGAWTSWGITSGKVTLPDGISKIVVLANTDGGLANIDYLQIVASESGSAPLPASCGFLPLGVESIAGEHTGYVIYPVPATTFVHIRLLDKTDNIRSVAIYSIDGKLIRKVGHLHNMHTSINIEELSNQMYLMYVTTDKKVMVKKFSVNKH
jgi:hypothetical protein